MGFWDRTSKGFLDPRAKLNLTKLDRLLECLGSQTCNCNVGGRQDNNILCECRERKNSPKCICPNWGKSEVHTFLGVIAFL